MKTFLRILFYLSITPIIIPIIPIVMVAIPSGILNNAYWGWEIMRSAFAPQTFFPFLERFPIIYYFPVFIIYIFGFVLFVLSGLFIILEKIKTKNHSKKIR